MQDYIQALAGGQRWNAMTRSQLRRNNVQTKWALPARIAIRVKLMRAILPILCSRLRSWTVLPSGL